MENTITETTTGSANAQNSVHPSPRLYVGVATLLVLVLAAAIVGPKLFHESAVSAAAPPPTVIVSEPLQNRLTEGSSSWASSRQ